MVEIPQNTHRNRRVVYILKHIVSQIFWGNSFGLLLQERKKEHTRSLIELKFDTSTKHKGNQFCKTTL